MHQSHFQLNNLFFILIILYLSFILGCKPISWGTHSYGLKSKSIYYFGIKKFTMYDSLGHKLYTQTYKNGNLQGKYSAYYLNGRKKRVSMISLAGCYKTFYENGKLEVSGKYSKGKEVLMYNPDSMQISELDYKYFAAEDNYVTNGLWKEYYPSGKLKSKRYFSRKYVRYFRRIEELVYGTTFLSLPEKKWKFYDEDGKLLNVLIFQKNEILGIDSLMKLQVQFPE